MTYIITPSDVGRDIDDINKELKKKPKPVKVKYEEWDKSFVKFAFESIQKDLPNAKAPNFVEWAITARKMRDIDKRIDWNLVVQINPLDDRPLGQLVECNHQYR